MGWSGVGPLRRAERSPEGVLVVPVPATDLLDISGAIGRCQSGCRDARLKKTVFGVGYWLYSKCSLGKLNSLGKSDNRFVDGVRGFARPSSSWVTLREAPCDLDPG